VWGGGGGGGVGWRGGGWFGGGVWGGGGGVGGGGCFGRGLDHGAKFFQDMGMEIEFIRLSLQISLRKLISS